MTDEPRKFLAIAGSGRPAHDLTGEMAERIKDVVYEYSGKMPVASAIGVLEIVKIEIMDGQR